MRNTAKGASRDVGDRQCVSGIGRAVVGAGVMALALGVSGGVSAVITQRWDIPGSESRLLPAVLCSVIAVSLVLMLRVRWDRLPLSGIGLTGLHESAKAFLLGVVVTVGSAAAVFGVGTAAGWVRWGPFDLTALLVFVLSNGIIALLLEALPEELTLRGYAWTALRERHRAAVATVGTTALFLTVPVVALAMHATIIAIFAGEPSRLGIAPAGDNPFSYLALLTVFGLTLVAARTATVSASLWTCIGTHLAFLTVNRVILSGQQRGAGWSAELTTPYAFLLVPAYLAVAALIYLTIAHRLGPHQK